MQADEVLDYWFGSLRSDPGALPERTTFWFGAPSTTRDNEIRTRFGSMLEQAAAGKLDAWADSPSGTEALIILLDQFPRNIYRGTDRAFAYDSLSRGLCVDGLAAGHDQALSSFERVFFYLPLEHSESLADQERCVTLMKALQSEVPEDLAEAFAGFTQYAIDHEKIIRQFGRFPHRNRVLGRKNTPEEVTYLAGDSPGFGQS